MFTFRNEGPPVIYQLLHAGLSTRMTTTRLQTTAVALIRLFGLRHRPQPDRGVQRSSLQHLAPPPTMQARPYFFDSGAARCASPRLALQEL